MAMLSGGFEVLRWLGVAYLIYLGVQAWREPPVLATANGAVTPPKTKRIFLQAVFVAWTNPKLLGFYAAFFPQFIDPTLPTGPQLWAMCGAFLVIAVVFDSCYAVVGGRLLSAIKSERAQRVRNRITGGVLIAAGLGLAMVRRN